MGTATAMSYAVYANPVNVAPADQLAAALDSSTKVRLRSFIDDRSLYLVDEDAIWRGLDLLAASEIVFELDDGDGDE